MAKLLYKMLKKTTIISFLIISFIVTFLCPDKSSAISAKQKYFRAEACYNKLIKSPKRQKYRHNWLKCIKKFQAVYKLNPSGPWAAAGLYKSGELFRELYKRSFKMSDKKEALDIFERTIKRFPKSRYKQKAKQAKQALLKSGKKRYTSKRKSTKEDKIAKIIKESSSNKKSTIKSEKKSNKYVTVEGLRFWSNPSYTRIVIDADGETTYTHRLLKKDPSINKPQRLFVDLYNSKLGKNIKKVFPSMMICSAMPGPANIH